LLAAGAATAQLCLLPSNQNWASENEEKKKKEPIHGQYSATRVLHDQWKKEKEKRDKISLQVK
jgi:hypothetical protein